MRDEIFELKVRYTSGMRNCIANYIVCLDFFRCLI